MKFLTLILIALLFAGGGWYGWDKYGKYKYSNNVSSESDLRIKKLEQKAAELYPTKLSSRKAWLDSQIGSLDKLSSPLTDVSPERYAQILKLAEKKFPLDYETQLQFVREQEVGAKALDNTIASFGDSIFAKQAAQKFSELLAGDFKRQNEALVSAMSQFGRIGEKAAQMRPADAKILLEKVIPKFFENPENAEVEFDVQFLARHNFLTKTFPEAYGDLRAGIEESFPDDFVAQLDELNKRVERCSLRGDKPKEWVVGELFSDLRDGIYKKYVYQNGMGESSYCVYTLKINGVTFLAFPSEKLREIDGVFNLDIGDIVVNERNIYIGKNCSLAFVRAPEGFESSIMDFAEPENGEIEIIGMSKDGRRVGISAEIVDGKIKIPSDKHKELRRFQNDAIVVSKKSRKIIGFYERYLSGVEDMFYKYQKGRDILYYIERNRNSDSFPGSYELFSSGYIRSSYYDDPTQDTMLVLPSQLEELEKYIPAKFEAETESIRRLCEINWEMLVFFLENTFANARRSPFFSMATDRYANTFIDGPRISKRLFLSSYSNYLGLVQAELKTKLNPYRKNYPDNFYRSMKKIGIVQKRTAMAIEKFFDKALKDFSKEAFVHTDLAEGIEKEAYLPIGALEKDTADKKVKGYLPGVIFSPGN